MVALSTKAHPSPFDPLDRMPADEPRFVIRGSDPAGPAAITEWSRIRRNLAIRAYGPQPTGDAERLLRAELAQCAEADDLALAWKEMQSGAEPVEGKVEHYSGSTMTEEQIAAAKRQRNQAELLRHLREAAYFAGEVLEGDGPNADPDLAVFQSQINDIANAVEFGGGKREAA